MGSKHVMEKPNIFSTLLFSGSHQCLHLGPQDRLPQFYVSHADMLSGQKQEMLPPCVFIKEKICLLKPAKLPIYELEFCPIFITESSTGMGNEMMIIG